MTTVALAAAEMTAGPVAETTMAALAEMTAGPEAVEMTAGPVAEMTAGPEAVEMTAGPVAQTTTAGLAAAETTEDRHDLAAAMVRTTSRRDLRRTTPSPKDKKFATRMDIAHGPARCC
jgi:hypothetical protein